jgi:hypothetical protein
MACQVADVSRQAFGDWRLREAAGPTPTQAAEAELVAEIRAIHAETDGTYGQPRVTEELARRGRPTNHKRVERLMRIHRIVGVFKAAKVRTTIPAEDAPPLPDLIGRRFATGKPDVAWAGDITYSAQRAVMCGDRRGAFGEGVLGVGGVHIIRGARGRRGAGPAVGT